MNFEQLHNYYEQLVLNYITENLTGLTETEDHDFLEDVACVALNQLPARYVRHHVDLAFYLPQQERVEMEQSVRRAVETAREFVSKHRGDSRPETITAEQA